MSSRMPDTHAEAWALLPWLATGRIAPEDREWVEAHVQGCAECRAELASQRLVASHVNRQESTSPQPAASEEQRSFNKLWARIEASESASTPATGTTGTIVGGITPITPGTTTAAATIPTTGGTATGTIATGTAIITAGDDGGRRRR